MHQVVWFKRDLRLSDHAPLRAAAQAARVAGARVVAVWFDEPDMWMQPDAAGQHRAFASECLAALDADLRGVGGELFVLPGSATAWAPLCCGVTKKPAMLGAMRATVR
jgi:deoxyribodipyrimidine photo-lyase